MESSTNQVDLPQLIEQLASANRRVQYAAETALRQIGTPATEAVLRGLQHPHP